MFCCIFVYIYSVGAVVKQLCDVIVGFMSVYGFTSFAEAVKLAKFYHAGQTRRDGVTPYVTHCVIVGSVVWELTGDEELAAAAVLHDAVEDTALTFDALPMSMSDRQKAVIRRVTKTKGVSRRSYLNAILDDPVIDSAIVKQADTAHNLSSASRWAPELVEFYVASLLKLESKTGLTSPFRVQPSW